MKKIIISFVLFVMLSTNFSASETTITINKGLSSCLNNKLVLNPLNREYTIDQLESITNFSCENESIYDLNGLEYMTNLEYLNIASSHITSDKLTPISNLTNLKQLRIIKSSLTDLDYLSNLTNLESLWLYDNQINDLTGITGLTNLDYLRLDNNQISDLSPLTTLTNLVDLNLENNYIEDLLALSTLTNLETLWLSNNEVFDLTPLSNLDNLIELGFSDNNVETLDGVENLVNLTTLKFFNNNVEDISNLSNLVNLENIYFPNNKVSDISVFENFKNLEIARIDGNNISDISAISELYSLRNFLANDNNISDISPVKDLYNLTSLNLKNNSIMDASYASVSSNYNVSDQVVNLDPINVISGDEITYKVLDPEGNSYDLSLGYPSFGNNLLTSHLDPFTYDTYNDKWDITINQEVNYARGSGDKNASVYEDNKYTDEMLIDLYNVKSYLSLNVYVDQSLVDYHTPGIYPITFYDEENNFYKASLEVIDVVPTLDIHTKEVNLFVGENLDILKTLINITATEHNHNDLFHMISFDDSNIDYHTPGSYVLNIHVSDNEGNILSDLIHVNVLSTNRPTIDVIDDETSTGGGDITDGGDETITEVEGETLIEVEDENTSDNQIPDNIDVDSTQSDDVVNIDSNELKVLNTGGKVLFDSILIISLIFGLVIYRKKLNN